MCSSAPRWSLPILLIASMGGCTGAPPATPAADQAADQAAITDAVDAITPAFAAAVAAKDTNAIGAMYADDAHMLAPNMPRVDGKDAIRHSWAEFMSTPGVELVPEANTRIVSEAGDMVVELGTYLFKGQDAGGKPMIDHGKYVTVYRKVGGEWKIAVDTYNSDIPLPRM